MTASPDLDQESADWLDDGFLTTVEASELLRGVIPLDIRRWCQKGMVRYLKEPATGRYLVCETDVRAIAAYCAGASATLAQIRRWKTHP